MAPDDCDPRHNVRPPLDGPDPCEPAPDGCVPACGVDGPGVWEFARAPAVPPLPALPGDGAAPADPALDPPEPLPAVGVVTGGAASGPEAGDPAEGAGPEVGPVVGPVAGGTVPPAGGAMPHSSQKPSSPTVPEQSGWVHRVIAPPPPRSPTL
ncbi:hypothetical protein ABZ801_00190 [Actinomadura sp. NPDC047616]|uniref:hypothetical protein n=1 Tax=Actinomadura sp. NPDC047616 TaxID=3155914 RepID=UPI0033FE20DE